MVHGGVVCRAKRNQILFGIVAGLGAEFPVMDLKVGHGAAGLASPAISGQHLVAELFVQRGVKPKARPLGQEPIHDAHVQAPVRRPGLPQ